MSSWTRQLSRAGLCGLLLGTGLSRNGMRVLGCRGTYRNALISAFVGDKASCQRDVASSAALGCHQAGLVLLLVVGHVLYKDTQKCQP